MATMRVKSFGEVATFVVYRADGHELSLSSMSNGLIEFKGNKIIKDHGAVYGPETYATILEEFLSGESDHELIRNVYSRHERRSA